MAHSFRKVESIMVGEARQNGSHLSAGRSLWQSSPHRGQTKNQRELD